MCGDRYCGAIALVHIVQLQHLDRSLGKKKEEEGKSENSTSGTGKGNDVPFVHTYFMKFRDIFLQLISAVHDCPPRPRADSLVEETRSDGQARLFRAQISNQEYQSSPRLSRARLEPSIGIVHRDIHYQIFELKMENVHTSICRFHNLRGIRNWSRATNAFVLVFSYRTRTRDLFSCCMPMWINALVISTMCVTSQMNLQFHL